MPDFTIEGSPSGIRGRVATMRSKAHEFVATGDALARITTDGWNSRAADRFREKFSTEPARWRASGEGFLTAASALEAYASALESAQSRATWAEGEYARGGQVSQQAKAAYDADVTRARNEAHAKAAAGQVVTLTIEPFHDPGAAIQQNALHELASARADLENAAHACAAGVRAGCEAAPPKRHWWESVGAAIGGFLEGAGEALVDLGKLAMWVTQPEIMMAMSLMQDGMSGLTAEEIAEKWKLKLDDVKGMLDALQKDPVEFGKQLGKGMLDWDTWSDDPARALGHLVPDAIIAVLTMGEGTVATRGAKALEGGAEGLEGVSRLDDLAGLSKLDDLGDLSKLDELGDLGKTDGPGGMWEHSSTEFRTLDDQLRDPSFSPANRDIIEHDYDPLGGYGSPEAFKERFRKETGDPDWPEDWDWPPNDGAVPGSREIVAPGERLSIDRIGGDRGAYFAPEGTPMGERSLPPDRLNFDRTHWEVDADHPALRSGEVRLERSDIAPWFGQDGGGVQYRFLDGEGNPLSQAQVDKLGIIKKVGD